MSDLDPAPSTDQPNSGLAGSSAVREFSGVHRLIRGYLTKFDEALAQPRSGDDVWTRTLADGVLFGIAGTRFHHHTEDDEFWPAVIANGADPALLASLQVQHRELDPVLDRLEPAAARLREAPGDAVVFATVTELMGEFRDHMRSHLDAEEPIFFPLLAQYLSDSEAHRLSATIAKSAPRKGISWLMGGVTYAMKAEESTQFLQSFPKPVVWLRPLFLRTYHRNCATLGVSPQFT